VSATALVAGAFATSASAQFGNRQRNPGDGGSKNSQRSGDSNPRVAAPPVVDPAAALERELPSLRIDLKLGAEQSPLFDSFERQVHSTAEAGRTRARHLSAFRIDDGSTVPANQVLSTIANDDAERADAARLALDKMTVLYAALTPDQQRQFDRRIIQALREPLGNS